MWGPVACNLICTLLMYLCVCWYRFLYTVLCDSVVQSGIRRVLVVCNKQDLTLARAAPLIQMTLEKEMYVVNTLYSHLLKIFPTFDLDLEEWWSPNIKNCSCYPSCDIPFTCIAFFFRNVLRETRSSQLQSVGEGSNNNRYLGRHGQDFEFSHLGPIKVEFVEAVARGSDKLGPVTNWLKQVAWS